MGGPKRDPKTGDGKRTSKAGTDLMIFWLLQALAFYQWCNYWQANAEREPLVINMDESSLAFHWSGLVGTVAEAAVSVATDKAKLSSRRAR